MDQVGRLHERLENAKDQRSMQASFLDVVKAHQPALLKVETARLASLNRAVSELTQQLVRAGGTVD